MAESESVPGAVKTRYELLVEDWKDCQRCALSRTRKNVVMARGKIPCDILFIGEGPGESEDVLSKPFVGPAGKLLDKIIGEALQGRLCARCGRHERNDGFPCKDCSRPKNASWIGIRCAFFNLVGCVPKDSGGSKSGAPEDQCVEACRPRLERFVKICKPRLIVCVGSVARTFLEPGFAHSVRVDRGIPRIDIYHPSWLLRQKIGQRGAMIDRTVITIQQAAEDLLVGRLEKK